MLSKANAFRIAASAVVALKLGIPVSSADEIGITMVIESLSRESLLSQCKVSIAGYLARERVEPRGDYETRCEKAVRRTLSNLTATAAEREALLSKLIAETRQLLDQRWEAVERLAKVLAKKGKLKGTTIRKTVSKGEPQ